MKGSEACDAGMNDSPVDCQNRGGTERRSVRIIRPYKCSYGSHRHPHRPVLDSPVLKSGVLAAAIYTYIING